MTAAERAKLVRILAGFDEPALEALANKGLVRRAQKDLGTETLTHEEHDNCVTVRGKDWSVSMPPDGPAKATDSTHATGITRPILMAALYLREQYKPDGPTAATFDPEPVLLAITQAELEKWAGKTIVRDARAQLPEAGSVTVEAAADLRICFTKNDILVRFGGGDETTPRKLFLAALATGPKSQEMFWKVAAILALHRARGVEQTSKTAVKTPSGSAPIERAKALAAARTLFKEMVNAGLAHVSERTRQRLFTLSLTCQALELPRLARLLRSLADDTDRALRRDASADSATFFQRLATADALTLALERAGDAVRIALAGQSRTEYAAAGDLALVGLGAWPWQTGSGYEGVTVLFRDREADRTFTVTSSRPSRHTGRRTWDDAYAAECVWPGGPSLGELARSSFRLRKARVNPQGRLSTSKESSVELEQVPFEQPTGRQVFTDWLMLANHSATLHAIGLQLPQPQDAFVILKPATWGERVFVELDQRLRWRLEDGHGRTVDLTLPWCGVNETAIEFLELVNPERDTLEAVVARAAFDRGTLTFEPLALLSRGTPKGDRVLCPGFDRKRIDSKHSTLLQRLREKFGRDRVLTTLAEEEEADFGAPLPTAGGALAERLRHYGDLLLHRAEAGAGRDLQFVPQREAHARFFRSIGLNDLPNEDTLPAQFRLSLTQALLGVQTFLSSNTH